MTVWQWVGVVLAVLIIEVPWLFAGFVARIDVWAESWVGLHAVLVAIAVLYGIVALIAGDWVPW